MKNFCKLLIILVLGILLTPSVSISSESILTKTYKTEAPLSNNETLTAPKLNQEQVKFLEKMIAEGQLTFRFHSHEAYISPLLWSIWDADLKETMVTAFAIYCAMNDPEYPDLATVDVIDKQSGKKLAKYGVFGYKVY